MADFQKKDILRLKKVISEIAVNKVSPKFAYMISKNKLLIQNELDHLEVAMGNDEALNEYNAKRLNLCMKYSDKREDSSVIIIDNKYQITEKIDEFTADFELLREEFKEELDAEAERLKEANQLLDEICIINFHKIGIEFFPNNLTQRQYDILLNFVDD